MKKFYYIFATIALLTATAGCSDSNEINRDKAKRSVQLLNHVVNTKSGEILPLVTTAFDYVFNSTDMKIDVTVHTVLSDGAETTYKIEGLDMTEKKGVYSFQGSGNGIASLRGHIDTNEATVRVNYTTSDGYRVIATSKEIYSTQAATTFTYSDNQTDTKQQPIYQVTINAEKNTARIRIMDFLDKSASRSIIYLQSDKEVAITTTKEGYVIEASELSTTSLITVTHLNDDTGGISTSQQTVNIYPIADMKIAIDLENDRFECDMLIGNIQVHADGAVGN